MWLEAADTNTAQTLGLCSAVPFRIADIEIELQVHVVKMAPFQLLLGRPFFAATECETKDFASGHQQITITDPNNPLIRRTIATKMKRTSDPMESPEAGF